MLEKVWPFLRQTCLEHYIIMTSPPPTSEEQFLTTSPYNPQHDDELGFEKGVVVEVFEKGLDGWWKIRSDRANNCVCVTFSLCSANSFLFIANHESCVCTGLGPTNSSNVPSHIS